MLPPPLLLPVVGITVLPVVLIDTFPAPLSPYVMVRLFVLAALVANEVLCAE